MSRPGPKPTQPCGTLAAARRHYRNGESLCDACREVQNRSGRVRPENGPRKPASCGTRGGYHRHLRHGETPCSPCTEGNRAELRKQQAAHRVRKQHNDAVVRRLREQAP